MDIKKTSKSPKVLKSAKVPVNCVNEKSTKEKSLIKKKSGNSSEDVLQEIRKRYKNLNEKTVIVYKAGIKNISFYKKHLSGIVCAKVVNNKHKASVGHIFLKFDSKENALKSLKYFEGTNCQAHLCAEKQSSDDKKSLKKWRSPDELKIKYLLAKHLYVDLIPPMISKDEIEKLFPNNTAINFPQTESGMNLGHAFVEFKTNKEAIDCFMKHKNTKLTDSMNISSTINVNFQLKKTGIAQKRILKKSSGPRPQLLSAKDLDAFLNSMKENASNEMEKSIAQSKNNEKVSTKNKLKRILDAEEQPSKDISNSMKENASNEMEKSIAQSKNNEKVSTKNKLKRILDSEEQPSKDISNSKKPKVLKKKSKQ